MRYIFFGTPHFAAIILEKLIKAGLPPALVVANPDRPSGRKKALTPPPTKILAASNQIAVYQPEKLIANAPELSGIWDFAIVAAYGNIIKNDILKLPILGTIGVHPSLLPRYRGATPIQSVLLQGEIKTGVSLYLLDAEVDHGAILEQRDTLIQPDDTYLSLEENLAHLGAEMLVKILPNLKTAIPTSTPQNHSLATLTKKFITEDGLVDLEHDQPKLIYHKIKALNPEPGVYAHINNIRTKLLDATIIDNKICITKIQKAGKNPQDSTIYLQDTPPLRP